MSLYRWEQQPNQRLASVKDSMLSDVLILCLTWWSPAEPGV